MILPMDERRQITGLHKLAARGQALLMTEELAVVESGTAMADLFDQAGLDQGTARDVAAHLMALDAIDKLDISFAEAELGEDAEIIGDQLSFLP